VNPASLRPRLRSAGLVLVAVALCALPAACAHAPRPLPMPGPGASLPRVAVVPLENLSTLAEAGDRLTRLIFTGLVRTGRCEVVEAGDVDRAMEDLRIRPVGTLTREELGGLRDSLHVDYVLAGSVLEAGTLHTPDGDVPALAVALKLLDARTGRVIWAQMKARSGEDRETIFGWGRVLDREAVATELTTDLFEDFHLPAATDTAAVKGTGR
jgi:TolB-like protein